MIRAHGVAPEILQQLRQRGAQVVDTTCPFVSRIHRRAAQAVAEGRDVIIVGEREHSEVKGIQGWCQGHGYVVGDLEDDNTPVEKAPPVEDLGGGTWRVQGSAELEEVESALGVSLPSEDYDTFSGYVFNLLGMIPRDGSTPEVQDGGLTIKISQIKGHRLESAVVCRAEPAPVQEAAARA